MCAGLWPIGLSRHEPKVWCDEEPIFQGLAPDSHFTHQFVEIYGKLRFKMELLTGEGVFE